jgi:aryl-alcohol dehydrogenase-like predicted oxidoreductase
MPTMRTLGSTGERISALALGGYHLGLPRDSRETLRLIHAAIEGGLTFMENAWDYHDGESERVMGEALRAGYRDRVFLMTKIDGQTRKAAIAQMDQSLKRLRTDHLDLLMLNEIIRPEDPDTVFGPGGAMEALVEARKVGKIRYIGFAGHKDPALHLRMLEMGFPFDAVQMPLNLLDAQFRSFEQQVLPLLVERGIGVIGMRPLADGKLLDPGRIKALDALRYVMSLPTDTVVVGCPAMPDLALATHLLEAFEPMEPDEAEFFRRKVAAFAQDGRLEAYKTSAAHDGTVRNPRWLTALS